MVRIPRLNLPSPGGRTNITDQVSKSVVGITDYMMKQEKDETAIQKAKLDSDLRVNLAVKADELQQDPAVQENPELFSEELNKYGTEYINNSTQDLSYFQKNQVGSALQDTLNQHVAYKGTKYQIKQNTVNQLNDLDSIINNASTEAFRSPDDANNAKVALTNKIKGLQEEGVLTVDQGIGVAKKGLARIDKGVIEGYFDKGDLQGAEDFLSSEDIQRDMGEPALAQYKGQLNQLKYKHQKEILKLQKEQYDILAVEQALKSGTALDPTNPDTQKALDLHYDNTTYMASGGQEVSLSEGFQSLDPRAGAKLVDQIHRTAYIPKTAEDTLNSFVLNGNLEQQKYALDVISRIDEGDKYGMATKFLDKRTQIIATSVNKDINAGMPLSKAMKIAEEKLNINKDVADRRRMVLNKIHSSGEIDFTEQMKKSIETAVGVDGEHWYWFDSKFDKRIDPIQADKALVDYQVLFDDHFKLTGDKDTATKMANKDFSRLYTVSEASGGKRIMKYAPELYYSIPELDREQNAEWQRRQLKKEVSNSLGLNLHSKNIILVPDGQTAREANTKGGQPTYAVILKNDKGEYMPAMKNGVPQRFRYDATDITERTKAKLIKERDDLMKWRINEAKRTFMAKEARKDSKSLSWYINRHNFVPDDATD